VPEVVVPAKPVQPIRVTPKPKPLRELKDISFVHIKRELENIKSTGGDSLYEHVQKVFKHMILHNPEKALERFEEISYMIKNGIEPSEFLKIEDSRSYRGAAGNCTDYVEKMAPHFAQGEPDEEGNIP